MSILTNARVYVTTFDPANKQHRIAYATFLKTKNWPAGFRFGSELPYTSVVSTVQGKLAQHAVAVELDELCQEEVEHIA